MIWLISQLLVQPSISLFYFCHIIVFWKWAYVWFYNQKNRKNLEGISRKILSIKTIQEIVLLMHWQQMGPMNYNDAYYWVHFMCKQLFTLWIFISKTFQDSMPKLLELFKDEEPRWYEIMRSFKFHLYLNFLVGVYKSWINWIIFQHDMIDITTISTTIDITILLLSHYCILEVGLCLVL